MVEKFTGLSGVEFYNLFSEEEYVESRSAIVRIDLKNSQKWWLATDILLRFGQLTCLKGLGDRDYVVSKGQVNRAVPGLHVNQIDIGFRSWPGPITREQLGDISRSNEGWRFLLEEVGKLRGV